jgi:hypothetical protein
MGVNFTICLTYRMGSLRQIGLRRCLMLGIVILVLTQGAMATLAVAGVFKTIHLHCYMVARIIGSLVAQSWGGEPSEANTVPLHGGARCISLHESHGWPHPRPPLQM